MPAKVTLSLIQGDRSAKTFEFAERTTCIIGRSSDCTLRVPNDQAHQAISRHHCLLDINPPDIRVRDFGSLNGTFVNGKKIGRPDDDATQEQADENPLAECDLKDGDEIRLQQTVFKVGVVVPTYCAQCWDEIPEGGKEAARTADGRYVCDGCRSKPATSMLYVPGALLCSKCGCDISAEIGEHRRGEFICHECKNAPSKVLKRVQTVVANQDDKRLHGIQGYTILKELERSSLGGVYLASHMKTHEQVALKVMLPRVAVTPRAKENFLRAPQNTQALDHPHVVKLRDFGCSLGAFYFEFEHCDGGSVDRLMGERDGKLSVAEAVPLILQVLDGLAYAHQAEVPQVKRADGTFGKGRGWVHRDLNPSNLLLSGSGGSRNAKIADFGLLKAFDLAGLGGQTSTGSAAGTPYFLPRQQVINFRFAKPEADVWAVAACLYQMLTGMFVPRDFPPDKDPWQVVLNTAAVPIRNRDPAIPAKLAEVIDHALVDKPEIQVKTAAELKRMLEGAV